MVEWKKLGELGTFENIGTDKKIVEGEDIVTLLNYVDVYHHKYIDSSVPQMQVSASSKKIADCTVEKGDIFVTPSSETVDDIGHSSVITETISNAVYSYHIMRYRLFEKNMLLSYYINYSFDTDNVKRQILKKAQGLTRFGLSKDKFASILIPIPSLEEQTRIVGILDTFTSAIDNLKEQIAQRRKQYEYYRDQLLDLEGKPGVEMKTLGEVCIKTPNIRWKNTSNNEAFKYIDLSSVNRDTHTIDNVLEINKDNAPSRAQQIVYKGDVILGTTRPTLRRYCQIPQQYDNQICSTGFCIYRANKDIVLNRWLFHNIGNRNFWDYCELKQQGAGYPCLSNSDAFAYIIPVPSLQDQQRIVSILDTFEASIQNLEAQLKEREKQYEYYRNKLLKFE